MSNDAGFPELLAELHVARVLVLGKSDHVGTKLGLEFGEFRLIPVGCHGSGAATVCEAARYSGHTLGS